MLNNKVTSTICQGMHSNATMSVKHWLYFVSKMYNNNNPPNGGICAHSLPGPRYLESFQCSMPKNAINIFTLFHLYFNIEVGTGQDWGATHIMWPLFYHLTSLQMKTDKSKCQVKPQGRLNEELIRKGHFTNLLYVVSGPEGGGPVGLDEISPFWAPGGTTVFSPDYWLLVQKPKFCKKGEVRAVDSYRLWEGMGRECRSYDVI